MAHDHKKAPGTETRGGVTSTMGNPMKASSSVGSSTTMKPPFNQPRAGGDKLPTTVMAKGITAPAVPKPSQPAPNGAQGGQARKGSGGLLRDRK